MSGASKRKVPASVAALAAPRLWGIVPGVVYNWAPESFVLPPDGMVEAFIEAGKDEKTKAQKQDKIWRDFYGLPWRIADGAPTLRLAPPSEALALRLHEAQAIFDKTKQVAKERLDKRLEAIKSDEVLTDAEKQEKCEDLQDAAEIDIVRKGYACFDSELRHDALSECVKGWKNMRAEWTGDWSVDSQALLKEWCDQAFLAILNGTAFSREEVEGFTSRPASDAA